MSVWSNIGIAWQDFGDSIWGDDHIKRLEDTKRRFEFMRDGLQHIHSCYLAIYTHRKNFTEVAKLECKKIPTINYVPNTDVPLRRYVNLTSVGTAAGLLTVAHLLAKWRQANALKTATGLGATEAEIAAALSATSASETAVMTTEMAGALRSLAFAARAATWLGRLGVAAAALGLIANGILGAVSVAKRRQAIAKLAEHCHKMDAEVVLIKAEIDAMERVLRATFAPFITMGNGRNHITLANGKDKFYSDEFIEEFKALIVPLKDDIPSLSPRKYEAQCEAVRDKFRSVIETLTMRVSREAENLRSRQDLVDRLYKMVGRLEEKVFVSRYEAVIGKDLCHKMYEFHRHHPGSNRAPVLSLHAGQIVLAPATEVKLHRPHRPVLF